MSNLDAATLDRLLKLQTEVASAPPEVETLMDLVTRRAMEVTGTDGAAIEIQEGPELVYRTVGGLASGQLGLRVPFATSLSGLSIRSGHPELSLDTDLDERVDRDSCRRIGLRSMAVHPLWFEQSPVGVLKVMSRQPLAVGQRELEILSTLGQIVTTIIDRASAMARLEQENLSLQYLASHDGLTGLRNRSAFYERLHLALALGQRSENPVGVVVFDLDGLKAVNDRLGHLAGDFLIRSFAERLGRSVRESDTAARLGGDEFGVVFTQVTDAETARRLAGQLAAQIEGELEFEGQGFPLMTSYGVAVAPFDGVDPETILSVADARLYDHKRSRGRSRLTTG